MSDSFSAEPQITAPEPSSAPAPAAPAPEPQPVSLSDDALVEVKVNGELQRLPWKEAREQVMLHRDYTRKTQEIAAQRRAFESQQQEFEVQRQAITQQQQTLQSILQDPSKLGLLLAAQQAARAKQQAEPQPLTSAHLPTLQQSLLQQLEQAFDQKIANFQRQQQQESVESSLAAYIKAELGEHPILTIMPGAEDVVFGAADRSLSEWAKSTGTDLTRLPMTERLALAKQHLATAVESIKERWTQHVGEQGKQTAISKSKVEKGIEPKGGKGVVPKVPEVKTLADLDGAFLEYLQQQERASV